AEQADLLLTGGFFPTEEYVLIVWQILHRESGRILRGGEYRLPMEGLPGAYLGVGRSFSGTVDASGVDVVATAAGTAGARSGDAADAGEPDNGYRQAALV